MCTNTHKVLLKYILHSHMEEDYQTPWNGVLKSSVLEISEDSHTLQAYLFRHLNTERCTRFAKNSPLFSGLWFGFWPQTKIKQEIIYIQYHGCQILYRVSKKTVTISVGSGPHGLGSMLQRSHTPHRAYVWDLLNHFPLSTWYRYRFTTLLAGAQGLLAHPVYFSQLLQLFLMKYIMDGKYKWKVDTSNESFLLLNSHGQKFTVWQRL